MYSLLLDGYNATDFENLYKNPFKKDNTITLQNGYTVDINEVKTLFDDRDVMRVFTYYGYYKNFGLGTSFKECGNKILECFYFLDGLYNSYTAKELK